VTFHPRPARLAALAAICLLAAGGTGFLSGCAAFPTQRERLASLTNDRTFMQQERDRNCNPVAFKGCDAARVPLDRMKDHIDNAAKISAHGRITMQLRAIRRDRKAAIKAMKALGVKP
jgi:hypothetical protein